MNVQRDENILTMYRLQGICTFFFLKKEGSDGVQAVQRR